MTRFKRVRFRARALAVITFGLAFVWSSKANGQEAGARGQCWTKEAIRAAFQLHDVDSFKVQQLDACAFTVEAEYRMGSEQYKPGDETRTGISRWQAVYEQGKPMRLVAVYKTDSGPDDLGDCYQPVCLYDDTGKLKNVSVKQRLDATPQAIIPSTSESPARASRNANARPTADNAMTAKEINLAYRLTYVQETRGFITADQAVALRQRLRAMANDNGRIAPATNDGRFPTEADAETAHRAIAQFYMSGAISAEKALAMQNQIDMCFYHHQGCNPHR